MSKSYKHTFLVLALFASTQTQTFAQGASFTYQGRLNSAGVPANGNYDFTFTLYSVNSGGSAIAGPVTNAATAVTNGLFTTLVNLGPAFTGSSNWLEIAVRTNGPGSFTTLSPRNQVTPTPYAISAESVSGAISGSQLTSGTVPYYVMAGFQGPFYSTINGGLGNIVDGQYDVLGGGENNNIQSAFGTVGGGYNNSAGASGGYYATVGGGGGNNASGAEATIPGGYQNSAWGTYSTIGGGTGNRVYGDINGTGSSVIGGGDNNQILTNAPESVISGGTANRIYGDLNYAGGSVIAGGTYNVISNNATLSAIGGGEYNLIAGDTYDDGNSVIGGGYKNIIYSNSEYSVIGGGAENSIGYNSPYSALGGGFGNQVGGDFATVPGGIDNLAFGLASFAAGYGAQTYQNGTFVWADAEGSLFTATGPNQFLIRASGGVGIGTPAPQANVDIVSSNGVAAPQLRLVQENGSDYSRLRFQTGNMQDWDVAVGGANDQMNWYVPGYGNVMTLQTNGALAANSLTTGTIVSGGLTTSGITVNNDAGIHVSGAGSNTKTAAFVQTVTAGNYAGGDVTLINNPLCNGNPNAMLFVTRLWLVNTPDDSFDPVVVYYSGGTWEILSDTMNVGDTFNVLIVLP